MAFDPRTGWLELRNRAEGTVRELDGIIARYDRSITELESSLGALREQANQEKAAEGAPSSKTRNKIRSLQTSLATTRNNRKGTVRDKKKAQKELDKYNKKLTEAR